ncbi:MAG: hypothetical protein HOI15_14500 [Opitutales bacterium]|nr:hypothetical protein [Opitutales bacterium]
MNTQQPLQQIQIQREREAHYPNSKLTRQWASPADGKPAKRGQLTLNAKTPCMKTAYDRHHRAQRRLRIDCTTLDFNPSRPNGKNTRIAYPRIQVSAFSLNKLYLI